MGRHRLDIMDAKMKTLTQCERCGHTSYAELEKALARAHDAAEWYVEVCDFFDYAAAIYEAYDELVPDELVETYKSARLVIFERPVSSMPSSTHQPTNN